MNVHHCDLCVKKIVDRSMAVAVASGDFYPRHELCGTCGAPIKKILTRYKLS